MSAARLKAACAAAAGRRYMICQNSRRVDVVLTRDADDADVTEAYAAALLIGGVVTLPGAMVTHTLPPQVILCTPCRRHACNKSRYCCRICSGMYRLACVDSPLVRLLHWLHAPAA